MPRAIARCVLPVPGGPSSTTFSFPCRKSSWPRCSTTCFFTERWKVKSNSSRVLRAGKRAALIRFSPPWHSREETSVESTASRKRSCDHSPPGPARPAWAPRARRRAPSGPGRGGRARRVFVMPGSARRSGGAALDLDPGPGARSPRSRSRSTWWAGSVKVRPLAKERRWRATSSPVSSATGADLRLPDPDLDPAPGQARVERVVVAVPVQVGLGRHPHDEAAVEVGHRLRQRPHPLPLLGEPLGRPGADRAQEAPGDPPLPGVELGLEVLGRGEAPAGLEVGLQEALVALDDPLGLRVAGLAEDPADRQGAAEGGELLGRPPAAGVQGALAVPDDLLAAGRRGRPGSGRCPRSGRGLLGEDQRRGGGPRPAEGAGDDEPGRVWPWPTGISPAAPRGRTGRSRRADRRCAGRCGAQVERPDLAQVVVEDRLRPS